MGRKAAWTPAYTPPAVGPKSRLVRLVAVAPAVYKAGREIRL